MLPLKHNLRTEGSSAAIFNCVNTTFVLVKARGLLITEVRLGMLMLPLGRQTLRDYPGSGFTVSQMAASFCLLIILNKQSPNKFENL